VTERETTMSLRKLVALLAALSALLIWASEAVGG